MIAFALSLVSLFLLAGVAAIVLGILSLRRINRSSRMLKGRRLGKAAVVLPILTPPVVFLLLSRVDVIPSEAQCERHLSRLGEAMRVYTSANHNQLPLASKWCDLLLSVEGVSAEQLQCPGVRRRPWDVFYPLESYLHLRYQTASRLTGPCDYAMNEHVTSISGPPDLVLCFEAGPGWNQVGGPEMLTTDHHDGPGCNILFLDMHTEFIPSEKLARLRWKPAE